MHVSTQAELSRGECSGLRFLWLRSTGVIQYALISTNWGMCRAFDMDIVEDTAYLTRKLYYYISFHF